MLDNANLKQLLEQRRSLKQHVPADEWAARVELAACYRLIAHFRMTDWIYNHISLRLPGSHEHYLINPFGLLYEEVSASNLVKVDVHGRLAEDVPLDINPAAFVIHGAIHTARPEIACVLHTHTAAGVGVAAQKHGLLPISQHAFKLLDRLAYHDFEGIALDDDEQQRLIADIGSKDVLILRNHGLLTMGRSVREAFELMFFLERACQIQINALAGGSEVIHPPAAVCERTCRQFAGDDSYVQGRDWQALIRMLDRIDPSYRD
ncbi:class II aldolase/adducin family protein [Piscinibacter sakaiensis]|uniref:class II aldolase/adducin family protein n=1 Tax=Piscinibacter sakaiensis TaxID=1547922 RepID=UPI003AADEDB1